MAEYLINDPNAEWPDDVKEIEVGDPVMGGPKGPVNVPHQQLADRTELLKTELHSHVSATNAHQTIFASYATQEWVSGSFATKASLANHVSDKAAHGATVNVAAGTIVVRNNDGRAQVSEPVEGNDIANKTYVDGKLGDVQSSGGGDISAHLADHAAHGATSSPTGGKIAMWSAEGRMKTGAPEADNDAANKAYVDAAVSGIDPSDPDLGFVTSHINGSDVHNAASEPTPLRIAMRDASGRARFESPVAPKDAANKEYTDAASESAAVNKVNAHAAQTNAHSATSAPTPLRIAMRDASGRAQFEDPVAGKDAANKAYADALKEVTTGDASAGTVKFPNGLMLQWFTGPVAATQANQTLTWPVPFGVCLGVMVTTDISPVTSGIGGADVWFQLVSFNAANVIVYRQHASSGSESAKARIFGWGLTTGGNSGGGLPGGGGGGIGPGPEYPYLTPDL